MSSPIPSSATSSAQPVNLITAGNPSADGTGIAGSFLGKYYTRIMIGKYQRPSPFQKNNFNAKLAVFLPLPSTLGDSTSVDYTNVNLETIGDFINEGTAAGAGGALRVAGQLISDTGNLGAAGLGALATASNKSGGAIAGRAIGAVQNYMNQLFPPEQLSSAIQQTAGVAPNPNPSVAFQGPKLRDFSYTWNLYPRNAKESAAITKLIKVLKSAALPQFSSVSDSSILEYPDMCQINFFPWDSNGKQDNWGWTEKSIIRIKKCVISSVNVSYTSQGTPSFFEGTELPVSYQLTLDFKELEYMLRQDWDDVALPPGATLANIRRNFSAMELAAVTSDIARETSGGAVRAGTAIVTTGTGALAGLTVGLAQGPLEAGQDSRREVGQELLKGKATI